MMRSPGVSSSLSGALVIGTVVASAVLLRGGFFEAGQSVFVLLAGVAFAAAVIRDEEQTPRTMRSAPVVVLALLGAVALVSAIWTVGDSGDAARTGCVILGLAALTVASAVLCSGATGAERLATGIALVAGLAALAGLAGIVLRDEPWAERIGGSWRAGGPFEYPPALALLQVSALPILLVGMATGRRAVVPAATLGATLAAVVIALSESRLQVALGCAVLVVAVVWSRQTLGISSARPFAAAVLLVVVGILAAVLLGGYTTPGVTRGADERLLELLVLVGGASVVWLVLRSHLAGRTYRQAGSGARAYPISSGRLAVVAAVGGVILVTATLAVSAPVDGSGGFTHGRLDLWSGALEAAAERPLLGWGAGSFFEATDSFQGTNAIRFAHNLPIELAVELGILGLLLGLAFYGVCSLALLRARDARLLWLLGPAVAAFLVTNLVDWQWHFAGSAAIFAAALGPLIARPWRPNRCNAELAEAQTAKS